jgi:hypothetical protein
MLLKKVTLAALAGTALLAAAPAFADNSRGDRNNHRGGHVQNHRGEHFQNRGGFVNNHAPRYYGQHRFIVQRPYVVQRPVVYGYPYGHQVLGGLILGTVIGAAIANHAGGNY